MRYRRWRWKMSAGKLAAVAAVIVQRRPHQVARRTNRVTLTTIQPRIAEILAIRTACRVPSLIFHSTLSMLYTRETLAPMCLARFNWRAPRNFRTPHSAGEIAQAWSSWGDEVTCSMTTEDQTKPPGRRIPNGAACRHATRISSRTYIRPEEANRQKRRS